MNLNNIKETIKSNIDVRHKFKYVGARNQIEDFYGVIKKCYSAVFIIELDDGTIKSFSYNDYIIKNLKIIS